MGMFFLSQTLFYQSAYNAVFVDQFALISRRSSSRNDAVEDGDAQFVLSTEEVLTKSTVFVCTTMVRAHVLGVNSSLFTYNQLQFIIYSI